METASTASVNNETLALCDKISKESMRPLVTQKEFVYVDAELLYDFRLAGLLSLIRNGASDYNYIMQHVKEYLDADTLECAKFFPELGITEADIDAVLADPEKSAIIAAIAPPTKLLHELGRCIMVLNTLNTSKETHRPIQLTINQSRVQIHNYLKKQIARVVHMDDPSVIIHFTSYPGWKTVPQEVLKNQDAIFIYDIKEFLLEGTNSQKALTTDFGLGTVDIMALAQSDLNEADTPKGLSNMKMILSLFCTKFTFFKKTLLTKEINNG